MAVSWHAASQSGAHRGEEVHDEVGIVGVLASVEGLESSVQERRYCVHDKSDGWLQVTGPAGEDGLDFARDARVLVTGLSGGAELKHWFDEGWGGYLYIIDGACSSGRIGAVGG